MIRRDATLSRLYFFSDAINRVSTVAGVYVPVIAVRYI